jgi:prepilin-type N-terminal cleavage/methylation domain-containing protein
MKRDIYTKARLNSGITLIELLVVVAILGLLSVAVLPALTGNRENQSNRAAAQQVSGLLNQSRNDAIAVGRPGGMTVSSNELDISRCRVPPPYQGDVSPTQLVFSSLGAALTVGAGSVTNIVNAGVAAGDQVRFIGSGIVYSVSAIASPSFRILPIGPASTTPLPPTGVPMAFQIERQPRIVGSTSTLPSGAAIDMAWSGYGSFGGYTQFTAGDQVSIVFDATGVLKTLVINGIRTIPDGTVFLLVGRSDRRGNLYNPAAGPSAVDDTIGVNWQYATSYWVAIDPVSGQTRLAECQPSVGNDVEASQQWAREVMTAGGL